MTLKKIFSDFVFRLLNFAFRKSKHRHLQKSYILYGKKRINFFPKERLKNSLYKERITPKTFTCVREKI